ncbi:LysE family translocator [Kocuria sp.]|uniref:LysE family translocator n=1 Tax=Kocuria sp. TaxID=1871328 RepID=UPI0026DAFFAF|nr:LysE family translocator [Kocuria sp.]MDO4918727.1 LysE family translocator [Kocuria sp.]
MTGAQYGALLGVWIAGIVVPGPDVFVILRNAFLSSRRNAVVTALGVVVGNTTWIVLSLMGVTVLISGNPVLKLAVQVGGALFLARMGWTAIRAGMLSRAAGSGDAAAPGGAREGPHPAARAGRAPSAEDEAQRQELSVGGRSRFLGPSGLTPWRAAVQGLVTNLANAKALVFFVALFGSLVPADISWTEALRVLGMLVGTALVWFPTVAWVGSVPALASRFQARGAEVEIVSGVVFLLVAVGLLVEVALTL